MPVNITNVTVCFGNGVKREEYGPVRKAEVSMTAAVDQGEDGVVAMNYMATLARAKVAEMLGLEAPAAARELIEAPEPQPGEPVTATRKRRTKAEMEAAASAAGAASAGSAPTGGSTTVDDDWSETEKAPASTADEWLTEEPKPAASPITDADMAMHCSKTAQKLGGGEKVKAVISSYKPNDWAKPTFGVSDILQSQRPNFVEKLEALT